MTTTLQRLVSRILLCSLMVTSAGCTSMKRIDPVTEPGTTAFRQVKAGDTVVIQTRDGRTERFVVQQIQGDTLVAPDGVRYTSSEVLQLKRRAFSGGRTAALAGGIFAGVFLLVAAAAAAALGDIMGG